LIAARTWLAGNAIPRTITADGRSFAGADAADGDGTPSLPVVSSSLILISPVGLLFTEL
jgi:hypothetical protein